MRMIAAYLALYILILSVVTRGFYIRIMWWKREGVTRLNGTRGQKFVFAIGVFLDVLLNYTALAVTMLQFPAWGDSCNIPVQAHRPADRMARNGSKGLLSAAGLVRCRTLLLRIC